MDNLAQLSKEELVALLTQQAEMIALLLQQVEQLKQEIQRLKGQKPGASPLPAQPPAWVKANAVAKEPVEGKPRKKRSQAFTRPRETPTEERVSACAACPDCGRTLTGGTEYSRRQIIELPPIPPTLWTISGRRAIAACVTRPAFPKPLSPKSR